MYMSMCIYYFQVWSDGCWQICLYDLVIIIIVVVTPPPVSDDLWANRCHWLFIEWEKENQTSISGIKRKKKKKKDVSDQRILKANTYGTGNSRSKKKRNRTQMFFLFSVYHFVFDIICQKRIMYIIQLLFLFR
jgi:hypothetical protein